MPFGTYNIFLIPALPQIIKMTHFSDCTFASKFQAHHLNLRASTNDEDVQKRTSFCPLLICAQTHIINPVRVSGEALGKI
jgi:hypothetical protein